MPLPMVNNNEIKNLFFSLIRVNTSNPPGNEYVLALLIRNFLRNAGVPDNNNLKLFDHGNGRGSLFFKLDGRNTNITIGFAGHLDTVPPGSLSDWVQDPFEPIEKDGAIFGRGTVDMKGGITAILALCLSYLRTGPPPVNIACFFTADEEASGLGIRTLRQEGLFEYLSFLVIAEPTGGQPAVCEKGLVWYDVSVSGKTSHAAMADQGINALELGYEYLSRIKQDIISMSKENFLLGKNSFSITQAEGGVKINVIPDRAVFAVDIRLIPDEEFNGDTVEFLFQKHAKNITRSNSGLSLQWNIRDYRPALETNRKHPALAEIIELAGGKGLLGVNYFTDGSLVVPYYPKLPFIILGPGMPSECHCPNEKTTLASIVEAASYYRIFIDTLQPNWFSA
jgi:succinyl-diaminopimelate desuccinylase